MGTYRPSSQVIGRFYPPWFSVTVIVLRSISSHGMFWRAVYCNTQKVRWKEYTCVPILCVSSSPLDRISVNGVTKIIQNSFRRLRKLHEFFTSLTINKQSAVTWTHVVPTSRRQWRLQGSNFWTRTLISVDTCRIMLVHMSSKWYLRGEFHKQPLMPRVLWTDSFTETILCISQLRLGRNGWAILGIFGAFLLA